MLDEKTVAEWQAKTFPTSTLDGAYRHLCEEIKELGDALRDFDPRAPSDARAGQIENIDEEIGDVALLLTAVPRLAYTTVDRCATRSFEKASGRSYRWDASVGYMRHVEHDDGD